jgi:hypothetical protein
MAKHIPQVTMISYGIYEPWDRKTIPKLIKFATEIPVALNHEFGYVLHIRKGKNSLLDYTMEHPSFKDGNGHKAAPFTGEQYVKQNDYQFFLGDTFWEPLRDKAGRWELVTRLDGKEVARKVFNMIYSTDGA